MDARINEVNTNLEAELGRVFSETLNEVDKVEEKDREGVFRAMGYLVFALNGQAARNGSFEELHNSYEQLINKQYATSDIPEVQSRLFGLSDVLIQTVLTASPRLNDQEYLIFAEINSLGRIPLEGADGVKHFLNSSLVTRRLGKEIFVELTPKGREALEIYVNNNPDSVKSLEGNK